MGGVHGAILPLHQLIAPPLTANTIFQKLFAAQLHIISVPALTNTIQILFFTDRATVKEYQSKFATYADKFPHWAAHSDGMHQLAVWTALEAEGLGANLQHYNPLIDLKVQETWKISPDWDLSAQMVIGEPGQKAGEKTFKPVEGERFLTFGA